MRLSDPDPHAPFGFAQHRPRAHKHRSRATTHHRGIPVCNTRLLHPCLPPTCLQRSRSTPPHRGNLVSNTRLLHPCLPPTPPEPPRHARHPRVNPCAGYPTGHARVVPLRVPHSSPQGRPVSVSNLACCRCELLSYPTTKSTSTKSMQTS